jgi:hypothetical protein
VIRFVLLLLVAIFLVWCGTTVKLGEYTCAGHVKRIWNSEETQDFKEGVKQKATSEGTKELVRDIEDKAAPVVDKVKRGVKAGVKEVTESDTAHDVKDAAKDKDTARKPTEDTSEKPAGDARKKPAHE